MKNLIAFLLLSAFSSLCLAQAPSKDVPSSICPSRWEFTAVANVGELNPDLEQDFRAICIVTYQFDMVLNAHKNEMRFCYEKELLVDPSFKIALPLTLIWDTTSRKLIVGQTTMTNKHTTFIGCVVDMINKMDIPHDQKSVGFQGYLKFGTR
jgi:hypothetical protein